MIAFRLRNEHSLGREESEMSATLRSPAPAWLTIVGVGGVLWNLIGVCFYLGTVGVLGAPFVQPDQPVMPGWVTAAFALCTFGGVAGSLGLALRKRWARGVLWLALVAAIVDWGWVFAGYGVDPLGVAVLVIAALLAWLAHTGVARGWLR